MYKTVGRKLCWLRRKRFASQREIAQQLGLSFPNYSKMEAGLIIISVSRLMQIAEFYEVHPGSLMDQDEARMEYYSKEALELQQKIYAAETEIVRLQRMVMAHYEGLNSN